MKTDGMELPGLHGRDRLNASPSYKSTVKTKFANDATDFESNIDERRNSSGERKGP
jgi:hypothetical protein